jgi:putative ABC exporter
VIESPFLYLTVHSVRNQIRVRLRRLRQPRYLIATVLGAGYFWFVLMGRAFRRGQSRSMPSVPGQLRVGLPLGAALSMFVIAALAWVMPSARRPALAFTRPEVQHLFTAPISRRRLIRYRVLRSQIGALIGSLVVTVLLRPGRLAGGFMFFAGLAIIMATLNLYSTGVSLSRASTGARSWLPRTIAVAAIAIIAGTIAIHWNDFITAFETADFRELARLGSTGAAGIVLWPFRTLAALPLADSPRTFFAALPWALLMLALNYVWILRTDVPFEEASAELSEKLAKIRRQGLSALRKPSRSTKTPFTLAPIGRPETAIVWKNLIAMGRVLSWTVLLRVAPMLVIFSVAASRGERRTTDFLAFVSLVVAGFTMILGPQLARRDLRQDLNALATLKTWPIRGAGLVRGEIMAPAIVLTTVAWLALIVAAVLSTNATFAQDVVSRWSLLAGAMCIVPGIVLAQLVAQNGLAVTFPSWVSTDPRPGGVDAMGQGMLVMLAVLLALVVAILPAALVAGIVAGVLYLILGTIPVVLPAALAGAALLVEAFIGTEVIGAILERSDISAVDARES